MRTRNKIWIGGLITATFLTLASLNSRHLFVRKEGRFMDYPAVIYDYPDKVIEIKQGDKYLFARDYNHNGRFDMVEIFSNLPENNEFRKYANPESLEQIYTKIKSQ